ncbi:hypothetical protein MPTK1_5g18840 [Marchantia polymorpha subsp. ruderalis]|uniref:Uncharacterized protein n=2 Tax=Marchantia polymorpha TaxID=3197 RepID=A0AAF6BJV8_MARPO|nr:hypothetical protein MARPO_0073s0058 [Marchantia polymorpha]BBN12292.1 hypothetical protein Mp_5g18840 [Marchantia polymorpha subsp. ruderalis]|eukprot:PTQ35184.1 hypothetical protein MARPO_0073s0058 [Marchantia polymorpha]
MIRIAANMRPSGRLRARSEERGARIMGVTNHIGLIGLCPRAFERFVLIRLGPHHDQEDSLVSTTNENRLLFLFFLRENIVWKLAPSLFHSLTLHSFLLSFFLEPLTHLICLLLLVLLPFMHASCVLFASKHPVCRPGHGWAGSGGATSLTISPCMQQMRFDQRFFIKKRSNEDEEKIPFGCIRGTCP